MVLPQLSVRQANRQTRGTSLHAAQWIMVNKDKYPHTMGPNPAHGIAVVKCHIQPSLSFINHIHQLQPSSPPLDSPFHSSVYPPSPPWPILTFIFLFPLLGKKKTKSFWSFTVTLQLSIRCLHTPTQPLPLHLHILNHLIFSKLVMINVYATHRAVLIE